LFTDRKIQIDEKRIKEREMSTEKEAKLKHTTCDKLDKTTERNCYENGDKAIVEVETISSGLGIDLALELVVTKRKSY
jgi:hypothetical protein